MKVGRVTIIPEAYSGKGDPFINWPWRTNSSLFYIWDVFINHQCDLQQKHNADNVSLHCKGSVSLGAICYPHKIYIMFVFLNSLQVQHYIASYS